jgi:hypothetical protein
MNYSNNDEIESLKKDFGLTNEEIEGFLEFFDECIEETESNGRVINIGSKEEDK